MVVWRPREHGDVPARRRFPEFPRHGYCSPRSRRSRSISSRGQRRALFQAAAPPLPTMPSLMRYDKQCILPMFTKTNLHSQELCTSADSRFSHCILAS
nr:uncharacterized protein LOC117851653 isoform X6 [Setaria viridis]